MPRHRARATRRQRSTAAKTDLKTKTTAASKTLGVSETDAALSTQCTDLVNQADKNATPLTVDPLKQAVACGDYLDAVKTVKSDQADGRLVDEVEGRARQRERRTAALRGELRALPHPGLVDVRPDGPAGNSEPRSSVDGLGLAGGGGGNGGGIGFNLATATWTAASAPTRRAASPRRSTSSATGPHRSSRTATSASAPAGCPASRRARPCSRRPRSSRSSATSATAWTRPRSRA